MDGDMTNLAELLEQVGRDRPPPADGGFSLLPGPTGTAVAAVLGFTAHHVVAADTDPAWLSSQLTDCEVTRPLKPDFLAALAEHLDARPGGQDNLLVARGTGANDSAPVGIHSPDIAVPTQPPWPSHPRVERAQRYRTDVRVARMPGGLVTIGRGLAGRWEISLEVEEIRRGAGIGRRLAESGRALVPFDATLWAQVHPANVASMRAFLAAGYRPVGAEVLFTRAAPMAGP